MANRSLRYESAVVAVNVAIAFIFLFYTMITLRTRVVTRAIEFAVNRAQAEARVSSQLLQALERQEADLVERNKTWRFEFVGRLTPALDEIYATTENVQWNISVVAALRTAGRAARPSRGEGWTTAACDGLPHGFEVAAGDWHFNFRCSRAQPEGKLMIAFQLRTAAFPSEQTTADILNARFFCDERSWTTDEVERDVGRFGGAAECIAIDNPLRWQLVVRCPLGAEKCVGTYRMTARGVARQRLIGPRSIDDTSSEEP